MGSVDWTFASDNTLGAHPRVLAAMVESNVEAAHGYGDDEHSNAAIAEIRRLLGDHVEVALVATGTAANVLGMAHVMRPYECVVCPKTAHIYKDENTAPGSFGLTMLPIITTDGKLRPADLDDAIGALGNPHAAQPRVVSISQSTELGTVYTCAEIAALATKAHLHGLLLHVDGSRIANALVAESVSAKEMISDTGVDILSFGFSKNGAVMAEAIVILAPEIGDGLVYTVKRGMQLVSKGRFLGAQIAALLQDDLWLNNARVANAMARRLADSLTVASRVELTRSVEANHVFVRMPTEIHERLAGRYGFYEWSPGEFRLLSSWSTTEDQVDAFVSLALG